MDGKPIMAIIYDFDKTLTPEDMQNYSFIPALGMTPAQFWGATGEFSAKTGVERILSYMYMMIYMARQKGIKMTREWLRSLGKDIKYFEGVTTWFNRINAYGIANGVRVEHYLTSSGTKEIIDGCSIAKEFRMIYGCEFLFDDETHEPIWPKFAVNYTQKTQHLFRISKGVIEATDDDRLNEKTPVRRIPYRNIIYLGDGMTDIPMMILVKQNGGRSIAVYPRGKKDKVAQLYEDGRVNYICVADYSANSELEKVMKLIIDSISIASMLDKKEKSIIAKKE